MGIKLFLSIFNLVVVVAFAILFLIECCNSSRLFGNLDVRILTQGCFNSFFYEQKFFGFVVTWGNIPIKIVEVKNILNADVWNEGNFLKSKAPKKAGGNVLSKVRALPMVRCQLNKHSRYIKISCFSFCP
jgi:hypothetical protein